MRFHLAYVFERFPSFTQTFCVREVLELERQGLHPLLFSIRDTRSEKPRHFPDDLYQRIHFLPPEKELVAWVKAEKDANRLPQATVLSLRHWGARPDKLRLYEAAYIGRKMQEAGVRHTHSHFAGIGARVAWWLHHTQNFSYSFTGHANDILCHEPDLDLTLDRLIEHASLVVTVSDFTAANLRQRFPAAQDRIKRVYNGLNLALFSQPPINPAPAAPTPPLILSVGRLIEKKGYPDLIEACSHLKARGLDFRCEIAGDGPMEKSLSALIASRHLDSHVTLLGATPQHEIIRRLAATRVFALACATEHDGGMDNLPTVLMEAMAASVPCVSTRLAGVPEMVEDGVTGLLVPERHPAALATALEQLLTNQPLAAQMGAAGRTRARRLFAQETTARQLLHAFAAQGLMVFDPALAARHPSLAPAYARQFAWRALRLASRPSLRHRQPPPFLLAAHTPPSP